MLFLSSLGKMLTLVMFSYMQLCAGGEEGREGKGERERDPGTCYLQNASLFVIRKFKRDTVKIDILHKQMLSYLNEET